MENEYKILTCASYGASGSGIVTDYLMEFDNIHNSGNFEFRFLQDFGGITTLEDCLVHSHHRLNSDVAIRLFKKYVDYQAGDLFAKRYNKVFKGKFKQISYDFINSLVEGRWQGHWEEDQVLSAKYKDWLYYKIWTRIKRAIDFNRHYIGRYYPTRDMYYSNPSYEEFIAAVKTYLNNLFAIIDKDHKYDYLYFDQILPPDNLKRYFNYFDNIHVVIVDRDPRDYYIENVLKWGEKYLPHDLDTFIKVFKGLRKKLSDEDQSLNVLRIKMEDMIYKYDEFSKKINTFIGIDPTHHIFPKRNFNPSVSINNTQLWRKRKVDMDVIHRIEDELADYCYDFENIKP